MKIENLVEKDTVLDDDYLIVDGTDGTKKAKRKVVLDSDWKLIGTVSGSTNSPDVEVEHSIDISSYMSKAKEFLAILDFRYSHERDLRANFSVLINPNYPNFKNLYNGGFYFDASNFASVAIKLSTNNRIFSSKEWYNVKYYDNVVEENVKLYVYYR